MWAHLITHKILFLTHVVISFYLDHCSPLTSLAKCNHGPLMSIHSISREIIILSSLWSYHPLLNILSLAPWFPYHIMYLLLQNSLQFIISYLALLICYLCSSWIINLPFVPSPTPTLRLPKNLGHSESSHLSLKSSSNTTLPENWAKLGHWAEWVVWAFTASHSYPINHLWVCFHLLCFLFT